MNHRRRSIPHFHKYLKPGTLARIRDSTITARSNRLTTALSHIPIRRSTPPSSPPHSFTVDVIPFFANIYSPRCLQRKKLMAAKSIYFLPPTPVTDSPDLVTESFASDIIVAN
ncbi:hypothetical protein Lal_00009930 [Lupinus albus]|nr:hypothetical protein Lal_00009930 [Lupinus albus]